VNADRWQTAAVVFGVGFCAFLAAHLIDEFKWQAPIECHRLRA